MKLIDKDRVMTILSNKIADIELDMKCGFLKKRKGVNNILVLKHIISLIDTIEVKDVDLGDIIDTYINNHYSEGCDKGMISDANRDIGGVTYFDLMDIAKHFFELGIKAQKGE